MKRIILSLGTIVALGVMVVGGTTAFFSDTETSAGNTFTAGAIDLEIDNESYYNGEFNPGTSWDLKSLDGELFFNFLDLKPDDEGEDTISIHVDNNDAWACMDVTVDSFDDNGLTEPEEGDGDNTGGDDEGELQDEINFIWWNDDGDNVLEADEAEGTFFVQTSLAQLEIHVALADASGQGIFGPDPLVGGETYYIGKAWCYGDIQIDPVPTGQGVDPTVDSGIDCNGTGLDNTTQTDSVEGTVSFSAVQSRHNDNFFCEEGGLGCLDKADVIIVLDRSGSIPAADATSTVIAAAKAFVDALAPSADGIHVGLASFGSTASLDVHLTDDGDAVKTAIEGISFGGSTFLAGGITIADLELDNPGDGHDRDDIDSPDVMVIITDGAANVGGTGETEADAAKADGIEIFAVGVAISTTTAAFFEDEIVSPPGATHYFDSVDFASLEAILEGIAMCENDVN